MAKENKDKKAGKAGTGKAGTGKWQVYTTEGGLKRVRKSCAKCGAGVFMAQHEDRLSCGKCGYTEFTRDKLIKVFPEHHKNVKAKEKKEEAPAVEQPAEKKPGKK